MSLTRGWLIVLAGVVLSGVTFAPLGWAEAYIQAEKNSLSIEGWTLVMPEVNVDPKTGKTWVRYDHPDGSYQSWALGSGEEIKPKWAKKGRSGYNDAPAGYSVEDTQKIVDWWANGGEGTYEVKDGQMVPVAPVAPVAPQSGNKSGQAPGSKPRKDPCEGKPRSNNPFDECADVVVPR